MASTITKNDSAAAGAVSSTTSSSQPPKSQIIDLYGDPNIVGNDDVSKPLTGVLNPYAPQKGVHLYHFCASFCSNEVRLALHEKNIKYESHHISIIQGLYDQYDPSYVRINPRCVVPTLVVDGKVTTDAHNIIQYIEDTDLGGKDAPRLIPTDPIEAKVVEEYCKLASSLFIESLTYGQWPNRPKRSYLLNLLMKGNHEKKRKALMDHIKQYGDDPYLKAAYEGKLKIMNKMLNVLHSDDNMVEVEKATIDILRQLNNQLVTGPISIDENNWLCGKSYSKADMIWSVVFHRLKLCKLSYMWTNKDNMMPAIDTYADRLISRPQFQDGVVSWHTTSTFFKYLLLPKLTKAVQENKYMLGIGGMVIGSSILFSYFWN